MLPMQFIFFKTMNTKNMTRETTLTVEAIGNKQRGQGKMKKTKHNAPGASAREGHTKEKRECKVKMGR